MEIIKKFFKDESGATLVEYALLVALIAIAVVITIIAVQEGINDAFQSVANCLNGADANCR